MTTSKLLPTPSAKRVFGMLVLWLLEILALCCGAYYATYHAYTPLWRAGLTLLIWGGLTLAFRYISGPQAIFKGQVAKVIIFLLTTGIVTFCFFGKGLLYEPGGYWLSLDLWPVLLGLYIIVGKTVWDTFLLWQHLPLLLCSSKSIPYRRFHMVVIFILQGIVLAGYYAALAPGSMSYDTFNQLQQIDGSIGYNTWHPIAHTLLLKGLLMATGSLSAQSLCHILFFCLVTTAFAGELMKNRLRPVVLYIVILALVLMPQTGINLMTLWKDIPFTIALLWMTLMLYRAGTDQVFLRTGKGWGAFCLGLLLIVLLRYNGVLAFGLCLLYGLYYMVRYERKKTGRILAALGLCLLIIALVLGPLPKVLDANPNPAGMKLRPIYQGLGAMYVAEREQDLPAAARKAMAGVASPDQWATYYNPYFSDIYIQNVHRYIQNLSFISTGSSLHWYIEALEKAPAVILGDRFNLGLLSWSVPPDPLSYNNRYTLAIDENVTKAYGISRDENQAYTRLSTGVSYTEDFALLDIFFWRGGIYLLGLTMLLAYTLMYRRQGMAWHFPWLGNFIIVFLTMPAQDFRYIWFQGLIFPFLFLALMSQPGHIGDDEREAL